MSPFPSDCPRQLEQSKTGDAKASRNAKPLPAKATSLASFTTATGSWSWVSEPSRAGNSHNPGCSEEQREEWLGYAHHVPAFTL